MKNYSLIKMTVLIILLMGFSIAQDRCPKCGRAYGAYDSRQETERLADRRAHEASCPGRPSDPSDTDEGQSYKEPSYDWQAEQQRQQQEQLRLERERKQRELKNAAIETRKREQARREQFEIDKKNALSLLKFGAGELGLKGISGSDLKLKSIGQTTLKLKEPLFSKGSQGSAPPYLGNLDSKWPIVVDLKKVQGGTPEALRSANLKTHVLLKALENFPNDWEGSIRYLENRLADSPGDLAVRDALNLVRGYYMGYLGAKNVGDKYYRSGVRAWLRGNFDYAARSFATAFRENPNDTLLFRSFAYTFGLRDGSGICDMPTSCSHIIDIPENHTIEVEDLHKEIKQKLDEARSDLTLLPNNLQLRATLNHLEANAAYNDYLDWESGKSLSIDKHSLELISKGLDRLGEKDYIGSWEDFAKAFEENTDYRDIYFRIHYSKGLAAMQRLVPAYLPGDAPGNRTDLRKYQSIPEALWDQRTIEEYDAYQKKMLEMDERIMEMALFGDIPVGSSTVKFNQQIKNTDTENPWFGALSEEEKQRFIEADKFIRP